MREEWRPVVGYPGYEVSNLGQVRGKRGQALSHIKGNRGYFQVSLSDGPRGVTVRQVHRIVMDTFVGPLPNGLETRHLDGDKANNRLDNLRYGTPHENSMDNVRHGVNRNAAKTECKRGHSFVPINTYMERDGRRKCRACNQAHPSVWKAKQRGVELDIQQESDRIFDAITSRVGAA